MRERRLRGSTPALSLLLALGCVSPDADTELVEPVFFADQVPRTHQTYSSTQLPLLRDSEYVAAHVDLRDEARPAIVAETGSALSFNASLPERAVLRFAMAVAAVSEQAPKGPVRFRVSLETRDGGRDVVFDELVRERRRGRWLPREVDLADWSGSQALVSLETLRPPSDTAEDEHSRDLIPLWASPILSSRRLDDDRPNLILVSIDTLRADHLGAYGYSRGTTPNLDRFAAGAALYTQASATAPWTVPSHYSMLTGLFPSQHGVSGYFEEYWHDGRKLSGSIPYLPELLSRAGYQTLGVYSHFAVSSTYGFERGYHAYRRVGTDASIVVDHAVDYLKKTGAQPFFLFVHLIDPHWPYMPPIEFREYARSYIEPLGPRPRDISEILELVEHRKPPTRDGQADEVRHLYDAAISYADEHLGRFFDELDALGLDDASIVLVTSDHGEAFLEHGHWQHATTLYEEMLRVPMLVSWPSGGGSRVDEPVSITDVFPTFLDAAGVTLPPTDALTLVRHPRRDAPARRRRVFAEVTLMGTSDYETTIAIRTGASKYIAVLSGGFGELSVDHIRSEELYDLAADPAESHNLADIETTDLEPWRQALRLHLDSGRRLRAEHDSGGAVETDAELQRQLEALGYLR